MRFNTSEISLLLSIILLAAALFVAFPWRSPRQSITATRVALIEDQEHTAFRFMINEREVARLDEAGLHVIADIEYGGALIDSGDDAHENGAAENAP
jgi:hypothetical protein